jgi:DNA-binding CsgD family transcriptional regulator
LGKLKAFAAEEKAQLGSSTSAWVIITIPQLSYCINEHFLYNLFPMKNAHITHPTIKLHGDIQNICKPLKKLNITYFSHIFVNNQKQFSAIASDPDYSAYYLKREYYKKREEFYPDSLFKQNLKNSFVMWDFIEVKGLSAKIYQEAADLFNIKHLFSIVEDAPSGRHYYNFASNTNDLSINQIYYANLDLLHKFIQYFKEKANESKELSACHKIKFQIEIPDKKIITLSNGMLNDKDRCDFLESIDSPCGKQGTEILNDRIILKNKNIDKLVKLTKQQTKCLHLLAAGYTNKQIASSLELSIRTVENYLNNIRTTLDCHTSKDLLVLYYAQTKNTIFKLE